MGTVATLSPGADNQALALFKTIFSKGDMVDIRAIHRDQTWTKDNSKRGGHYEPAPKIFHVTAEDIGKLLPALSSLNHGGRNIYFGVNPRLGKSMRLIADFRCVFVDLDDHNHDGSKRSLPPDEALEYLAEVRATTGIPHPSAIVNSGNGVHLYWRLDKVVDADQWKMLQKRLILAFEKYADRHVHDAPRIMRLPGFVNCRGGSPAVLIESNKTKFNLSSFSGLPTIQAPKPEQRTGNAADSTSFSRAEAYFSHRDGVRKGERNSEAYKIAAACLCDYALTEHDTEQIILTWNQKNAEPLQLPEIQQVISKASRGARGTVGSKNRDLPAPSAPPSPGSGPASSPFDQDRPPADVTPKSVEGAGRVDLNLLGDLLRDCHLIAGTTSVWHSGMNLEMRLEALSALHPEETKAWKLDRGKKVVRAENLVFRPSGVVADDQVNMFHGFSVKRDPRDCPMLRDHLEYLCGNDPTVTDWVSCWLAHQVQFPGQKLATALVIHGGQGTGKSLFFETFGKIFDPYFTVISQTDLESSFNGWGDRKVFILAEEVLAVKQRSLAKNRLKAMVTGKTMRINEKYLSSRDTECNFNLVFLSNELMPMLIESDDRRYCVIRRDGPKDNDYYCLLSQEIEDNGPGRLLNYLMDYPLEEWHAHSKPPMTAAKKELAGVSAPSYEEFLNEWIAGDIEDLPPIPATGADLYLAYASWCRLTGSHRFDRGFFLAHAKQYKLLDYRRCMSARTYHPTTKMQIEHLDVTGMKFRECLDKVIKRANQTGL